MFNGDMGQIVKIDPVESLIMKASPPDLGQPVHSECGVLLWLCEQGDTSADL